MRLHFTWLTSSSSYRNWERLLVERCDSVQTNSTTFDEKFHFIKKINKECENLIDTFHKVHRWKFYSRPSVPKHLVFGIDISWKGGERFLFFLTLLRLGSQLVVEQRYTRFENTHDICSRIVCQKKLCSNLPEIWQLCGKFDSDPFLFIWFFRLSPSFWDNRQFSVFNSIFY